MTTHVVARKLLSEIMLWRHTRGLITTVCDSRRRVPTRSPGAQTPDVQQNLPYTSKGQFLQQRGRSRWPASPVCLRETRCTAALSSLESSNPCVAGCSSLVTLMKVATTSSAHEQIGVQDRFVSQAWPSFPCEARREAGRSHSEDVRNAGRHHPVHGAAAMAATARPSDHDT